MKFWSTNEAYVYEERLALLGVIGNPDTERHRLALGDVERFRRERTDKETTKRKVNDV